MIDYGWMHPTYGEYTKRLYNYECSENWNEWVLLNIPVMKEWASRHKGDFLGLFQGVMIERGHMKRFEVRYNEVVKAIEQTEGTHVSLYIG